MSKLQRNSLSRQVLFYGKFVNTLMSQIVEHTEVDEHLEEIAANLIVEHLFYTISLATNNRTPGIFSTALIVKRAWLLGTPEWQSTVQKKE